MQKFSSNSSESKPNSSLLPLPACPTIDLKKNIMSGGFGCVEYIFKTQIVCLLYQNGSRIEL